MSSACHARKVQHSLEIVSCKKEALLCERVIALVEVEKLRLLHVLQGQA